MKEPRALSLALTVVAALLPAPARAYSGGGGGMIPGASGCNACHHGGAVPTVRLSSGGSTPASLELAPGDSRPVELRVEGSGGAVKAGFAVKSSSSGIAPGLLAGATGTEVVSDPGPVVTHSAPRTLSSGAATFSFQVTASASAACGSLATLTAWGCAVDGDGTTAGNKAAYTTLPVRVICPVKLQSLTLSPAAAKPGEVVTGTLELSLAAGASGLSATLGQESLGTTASAPALKLPAKVTVAAGARAGQFSFKTPAVTAPASYVISAVGGTDTGKVIARLTVRP